MRRLSQMLLLASVAALVIADASTASAQKKVSYEDAWAKCKEFVNAGGSPNDLGMSHGRYARGMTCMKQYGYRLKKSSLR
jgi:hypothetical protein